MITAKIYQDGKYVESIECGGHEHRNETLVLYEDEHYCYPKAFIPLSHMIVFTKSQPDYDKMSKELREKL